MSSVGHTILDARCGNVETSPDGLHPTLPETFRHASFEGSDRFRLGTPGTGKGSSWPFTSSGC
jgi:hypothetical protein